MPLSNALMGVRPSPVAALNRAIEVAQDQSPERRVEEMCANAGRDPLAGYPLH